MDTPRANLALEVGSNDEREHSISSSQADSPLSPSHHNRPLPASAHLTLRNEDAPWLRHRPRPTSSFILIFLIISCCISLSSASNFYIDEQMIEGEADVLDESIGSALARLAKSGTILVDEGPPPNPKAWTLATEHDDLQRRDLDDHSSSSSSTKDLRTSTVSSTGSMVTTASTSPAKTSSATSSGIVAVATQSSSPLPSPLDIGFSGNITDSCQSFMNDMLNNATFKSCLPFSLLLQNSNSFFQDSKSPVRITQVLDATCAANVMTCTPLLTSLATNLTTPTNCASDLASGNPTVIYTHLGLQAYKPLYTASCLRNPSTSSYCYADAVTNVSSPTDSYIYYLPLNISLPGGTQPTCDACLQNTMAVFEAASSDRGSALATDYVNAAIQINVKCGPSFVNQSLAAPVVSSGLSAGRVDTVSPGIGLSALVLWAGSWLL